MTSDQSTAFAWIAIDASRDGQNNIPMPFKLTRFRALRDSLVRAGLVIKTDAGRYVPLPDKPTRPGKPQGQSDRTPEGIA